MKRLLFFIVIILVQSCTERKLEKKGFQVAEIAEDEDGKKVVGLQLDSLKLETRPRGVLLTKHPSHRLTPIYKVNYDRKTGKPFTGSNHFYSKWEYDDNDGNNWNNHIMPGFEAIYGYNFVNISHYNNDENMQNEFFDSPALIKTLYYPSFSNDTLNYQPISRDYYMVSVYNEDTNQDGFITTNDLRRFYLFDIEGNKTKALVPTNYNVVSSEYDPGNDFMYVFAKVDENKNGQTEDEEATHIFWIDLKNPNNTGVQYKD